MILPSEFTKDESRSKLKELFSIVVEAGSLNVDKKMKKDTLHFVLDGYNSPRTSMSSKDIRQNT